MARLQRFWGHTPAERSLSLDVSPKFESLEPRLLLDGAMFPGQQWGVDQEPWDIAAADFDRDGDVDIATGNGGPYGQASVSVLLNNGDGTFQPAKQFAAGESPKAIISVDLNEDEFPDIVTASGASAAYILSIYLNSPGFVSKIDSPIHSGEILQGDSLRLTAHDSVPEGEATFIWDFGDGRTSTEQAPGAVTYHTPGVYEVSFAAINSEGMVDPSPDTRTITVIEDTGPVGDLVVTDIEAPEDITIGLSAEIRYTAFNRGEAAISGATWTDAVYLSDDPYLDAADKLLASETVSVDLDVDEAYSGIFNVTITGVQTEAPYLLISLDDAWDVLELHQLNNESAVATALAIPFLIDEVPLVTAFAEHGERHLYRVQVPEGKNLLLTLDDMDNVGVNEVYAKFGAVRTRGSYDYRYEGTAGPDAELLIRSPAPGVWYVMTYSGSVGASAGDYSITADTTSLVLLATSPDRSGNLVDATLTLLGAGFGPDTAAELVAADATAYAATIIDVQSAGRMTATFGGGTVPVGVYTVRVSDATGDFWELPDALEIVGGAYASEEAFQYDLTLPSMLGYHMPATFYAEYTNMGALPMRAPLLVITVEQNARQGAMLTLDSARLTAGLWSTGVPEGFDTQVTILASGDVPGWLQPGETARVPVYWAGWTPPFPPAYPDFDFLQGTITSDDARAMDWSEYKNTMRPDSVPVEAWDVIWANFVSQVGSTWGEFVLMLDRNAEYLGQLGSRVVDVDALVAFELLQAGGLTPLKIQASGTDVMTAAPGLPLLLTRSFGAPLSERHGLGPLGYGWRHIWEASANIAADGVVTMTDLSGKRRLFDPDVRGGYLPSPGDTGELIALGGGALELHESDGTKIVFNANGTFGYVQDTNGNRITAGYSAGLMMSLTHSAGLAMTFSYIGGRIDTITDPFGRQTRFFYDPARLHLLAVQGPDGRTTQYAYEPAGAAKHGLTSVEHPDGTHDYYGYNSKGWLTSVSGDGGADAVQFIQDDLGTVTADFGGSGESLVFYFGHRGEILKTKNSRGEAFHLAFDDAGQLTRSTDLFGRGYSYTYDSAGHLIATTSPLAATTATATATWTG